MIGSEDRGIFSYLKQVRCEVLYNQPMLDIVEQMAKTDALEMVEVLFEKYAGKYPHLSPGQQRTRWAHRIRRIDLLYKRLEFNAREKTDTAVDTNPPRLVKHLTRRVFVPRCPWHREDEDSEGTSACLFCELFWLHGPHYQYTLDVLLGCSANSIIDWQHERLLELFCTLDESKLLRYMLRVYFGNEIEFKTVEHSTIIEASLRKAIRKITQIKKSRPVIQDWMAMLAKGRSGTCNRVYELQTSGSSSVVPPQVQCPTHFGTESDFDCNSCFLCRALSPQPTTALACIIRVATTARSNDAHSKVLAVITSDNLETIFHMLQKVFPMPYSHALSLYKMIKETYHQHIKHPDMDWYVHDRGVTDETNVNPARELQEDDYDETKIHPAVEFHEDDYVVPWSPCADRI